MGMLYACKSDTGKRKNNEDACYVPDGSCPLPFAAVSDGMGGMAGGEIASRLVIEGLKRMLSAPSEQNENVLLRQVVRALHIDILDAVKADPSLRGMGATLVMALPREDTFTALNIGDSRLYHLHGDTLTRVTTDHSLVAALVAMGAITEEEARFHPRRNIITRAVGLDTLPAPDIRVCGWQAGDMLLLCSDGLSGALEDAGIAAILTDSGIRFAEKPDALIRAALEAGSTDNITVALVLNGGTDA